MPADAPSKSTLAIEMRDVAVGAMRDQSTLVAEQMNWSVPAGDYWVVAGLQGSGKSDFLLMTGGVMAPAGGTYRLFGEQMPIFDEARLKSRLRMGLVFETGQLFNHLTVSENISLPLRYHQDLPKAEAQERLQKILDATELAPWADSTPGAISRNWQKRVGLARALALEPELLLVDSPLTGLDLRHAYWWLNFLEQLGRGEGLANGRKMTLVVTAADLRPWRNQAHQFAVLKNKRLTVLGSWTALEKASEELVDELVGTKTE